MLGLSFFAKLVSCCACTALLVPVLCLGYTERVFHSIQEAWVYDRQGDYFKAIDICNNELADPELADVDRMHILVARSMFWAAMGNQDLWLEDQYHVLLLRRKSCDCSREFHMYYD